ncbi:MAG: hypothetical protein NVSMB52_20640 [Chloroflexota bacterium]
MAVLGARLLLDILNTRVQLFRLTAVGLAGFSVAFSSAYVTAYVSLFAGPQARAVAAEWIDRRTPTHSDLEFEILPTGLTNLPYFVTPRSHRQCFSRFAEHTSIRTGAFLALDEYSLEDHPHISQVKADKFVASLRARGQGQLVFHVSLRPSFLGLAVPLEGTPHDWRYPSHEITIYKMHAPLASTKPQVCFKDIPAALKALYISPDRF